MSCRIKSFKLTCLSFFCVIVFDVANASFTVLKEVTSSYCGLLDIFLISL